MSTEFLIVTALAAKQLDEQHAADVLSRKAIEPRDVQPLFAEGVPHDDCEPAHDDREERHDHERDESQLPAGPEQRSRHANDDEEVGNDRQGARCQQFVESGDVVGEAGDKPADRIAIVERDGHALEMAKELQPQIVHHLLGDDHHLHSLDVAEDEPDNQHRHVETSDQRQAVRLALRDVSVNGLLDKEWLCQSQGRRRQQQK